MHSRSHGQCNQSRFETVVFVLPQGAPGIHEPEAARWRRRDAIEAVQSDHLARSQRSPSIGAPTGCRGCRRAFPLQDPAAPNVETDALLLKQFTELQRLLEDPVPSVRVVAVDGASRILAEYWDLIPVRFAKRMLTTMVDRLARDASSTGVRAAVVEGLDHLIANAPNPTRL